MQHFLPDHKLKLVLFYGYYTASLDVSTYLLNVLYVYVCTDILFIGARCLSLLLQTYLALTFLTQKM
jgi:hypothetical protein